MNKHTEYATLSLSLTVILCLKICYKTIMHIGELCSLGSGLWCLHESLIAF